MTKYYPIYTPFKHEWYNDIWVGIMISLITIAVSIVLIYAAFPKLATKVQELITTGTIVRRVVVAIVHYLAVVLVILGLAALWYLFYEWIVADQSDAHTIDK